MKKKYTIGRLPHNDIVEDFDTISREHAVLIVQDDFSVRIKDKNSRNGTYVNGRRVRNKLIKQKDQVKLGDHNLDLTTFWKELQISIDNSRIDYSSEFKEMEPIFQEYQKKKKIISKKGEGWKTAVTILVPLIIVLGFVLKPDVIENDLLKFSLLIGSGLVVRFILHFISISPEKKRENLEVLAAEYEDELICPKCETKLHQHTLAYWKKRSTCGNSRCPVVFSPPD